VTGPLMKTNRRWIWFFVVLTAMGILAVGSLTLYNLAQQLKPEELAAARRRWKEKGPRSYQLSYQVKAGIAPQTTTSYVVRVRDGKVVSATVNMRPEARQRFGYYGMEALFDYIGEFLERDAKLPRRIYIRAFFDPDNGALQWFVRRVTGGTERVEITVKPLAPLEESPP
jgi:hypothetical protein